MNRIEDMNELISRGLDASRLESLSDADLELACLGAENGEIDWERGDRIKDTMEKQAKLYAESALGW